MLLVSTCALLTLLLFTWKPALVHWRLQQGRQRLETRENRQALVPLRAALRLAPDREEAILLLARSHRRLGQVERSGALLGYARNHGIDPDRTNRESWLLQAQTGRLREALPHLSELLLDPRADGMDICEAYVQGYFTNLRVHEATQLLDVWQSQYPADAKPYFMRGYMMQSIGDRKASAAAYREGLRRAPHNSLMRCQLAEVLMEQQKFEEAGQQIHLCMKRQPDAPEVLFTQARWRFDQGKAGEAAAGLRRILSRSPNDFKALRMLGEVELARGNFKQALQPVAEAVRLRPYDTTAHNTLGSVLRSLGRMAEAKPHLDYVAEAEESLTRMERQLREVVDQPDNVELRYEIGMTLLQYGSPEDGSKWLRTVLDLQPDHQGARQALTHLLPGGFSDEPFESYPTTGAHRARYSR